MNLKTIAQALIFEELPDPVIVSDGARVITALNPAAERLFGVQPDAIIGQPLSTLLPTTDATRLSLSDAAGGETDYHRSEHPLRNGDAVVGAVTRLRKVARPQQGAELEASEASFRALVEHTPDLIARVDLTGRIVYINRALAQLLGRSNAELKGTHGQELDVPEPLKDAARAAFYELCITGQASSIEVALEEAGQTRHFALKMLPERNAAGEMTHVICIAHDISAHKQLEGDLRQSEARYRTLVEQSPEALSLHAPDGRYLYMNRRHLETLGYAEATLLAMSPQELADLVHPDDYARTVDTANEQALLGQAIVGYRHRVRHKDGTYRWIENHTTALQDANGAIEQLLITMRDVDAEVRAAAALRQSEARYRTIAEQSHDAIALHTPDGRYIYVNPAHCALLGMSEAEAMALTPAQMTNLIHPDDAEAMQQVQRRMARGEGTASQEYRLRSSNGNYIWVESAINPIPMYDGDGAVFQFITMTRIIESRRKVEEQLRQSEALYRTLAESSSDGIALHSLDGRYLYANQAYVEMIGYSSAELRTFASDALHELCHPQDIETLLIPALARMAQGDASRNLVYRLRRKDGTAFWVESSIAPLPAVGGRVEQFLSTTRDITERRQMEANLRRSEALYRTLAEQSRDAIALQDIDGHYRYINPAYQALIGYSLEELQAMGLEARMALVHPDDLPKAVNDALARLAAGIPVQGIEYRVTDKAGHSKWVESYAAPLTDRTGSVVQFMATTRDITQRRAAEEETQAFLGDLRALQRLHLDLSSVGSLDMLYQRMIEMTRSELGIDRVAIWRLNAAGDTLHGTYGTDEAGNLRDERAYSEAAVAARRLPGGDGERHWTQAVLEAPGRTLLEEDAVLRSADAEVGRGWLAISALWNGERVIGYLMGDNYLSGRPAPPHINELFALLGNTYGHLIKHQEAEDALRRSRQQYRGIVDTQSDLICRTTPDGLLTFVNDAYCAYFKTPRSALLGTPFLAHLPQQERDIIQQIFTQLLARGQRTEFEFTDALSTDEDRLQIWTLSVVINDDGNPVEVQCVGRDVTEYKQAQERKLQLTLERERLQLLTTFVRGAAHEFRTPLSAIGTSAYLMARVDDAQRRSDKAEQIHKQIERLTRLVETLLLMAKLESRAAFQIEQVDLRHIVHVLHDQLRHRYGPAPALRLLLDDTLPTVQGDLEYLTTALMQLLDNAYRFTPEDGTITISSGTDATSIWLEIADTGIGIPDSALPKIFDTFWRQDEMHTTYGLGLGLAIAQKIVAAHAGDIEVESEVDVGSCFRVRLPR